MMGTEVEMMQAEEQEYKWSLEAGKGKEMDSPLGCPEGMQSCRPILEL